MKNALNFYYNLYSDNIRLNGENYYFDVNGEKYVLYAYNGSIQEAKQVYDLHLYLLQNRIYTHQIILNKDDNIITVFDNKQYVLLKIYNSLNEKITINDIVYFGNITTGIKKTNNWKQLWSNKIDYFEYQMSQFGKKYPLLRESFSYYVGIAENGIVLLNELEEIPSSISHKRIYHDENLFDFYNPLSYIIDIKVRDTAEFFKSRIFVSNNLFLEIQNYLSQARLSDKEMYYFFIRMLYPTFYFDYYEKIMDGELDEYKIKEVLNVTSKYENTLKMLYNFLKKYIKIQEIDWLNRI